MSKRCKIDRDSGPEEDAEASGGIYVLRCSCGWRSDNSYGGNYPREGEEILERLERIEHLMSRLVL
jgi:hypothetical protein